MELKVLKMAFEKLYDEFQVLKAEQEKLKNELKSKFNSNVLKETEKVEEEYWDAKTVIEKLGICAKTLWSMEKAGSIVPIKISKRRKKYSKLKILAFMQRGVQ